MWGKERSDATNATQGIFRVLPGYLSKRRLCHSAQLNILSPAPLGARKPVQRSVNVSAEGQTMISEMRLWFALTLVSTASSSFLPSLRLSDYLASANNVTVSASIVPPSLAHCERAHNSSELRRAHLQPSPSQSH